MKKSKSTKDGTSLVILEALKTGGVQTVAELLSKQKITLARLEKDFLNIADPVQITKIAARLRKIRHYHCEIDVLLQTITSKVTRAYLELLQLESYAMSAEPKDVVTFSPN